MPSVPTTSNPQSSPEEAPPERADLPAEVRFEPGAACLAPLHVVQDDGDDGRPADEEGAHHAGGADDAGEQAQGMERVDRVRPLEQRPSAGAGGRIERLRDRTHALPSIAPPAHRSRRGAVDLVPALWQDRRRQLGAATSTRRGHEAHSLGGGPRRPHLRQPHQQRRLRPGRRPGQGLPDHIRAATGKIDGAAIQANARETRDWLSYGLDYAETRFSRLRQINTDNVRCWASPGRTTSSPRAAWRRPRWWWTASCT